MTGCRTKKARWLCFLFTILVLWATQDLCAKKKPPVHPVNLNTATATELQEVPGIGPVTAEKILQMRKSYGAFKKVDDLEAIRGIGPKRLEKMRKYLTVGKPAQNEKPTPLAVISPKTPPAKDPRAKAAPSPPPVSETEEP
ncbi:MAG: helix-hairpin-helix domain-containing protein [Candidatus Acidiferrum sp.]